MSREGEYDRISTAAVNAYVGPGLAGYLGRLEQRLAAGGLTAPVLIMQSTGGVLPLQQAVRHAVGSVTSGPAGGAMAGAMFARLRDESHLVTFDMGGTSTDICLIEHGQPLERQVTQLDEVKIAVSALDVTALGAGGGSVAWIDPGGILALGPHSAGARPGPACYDRGGSQPTLTDANLVLGLISQETFLGGRLTLAKELAAKAVDTYVAQPLGLSVEQAALAINALASARIAEGIRANTIQRGLDPRDFSVFCFGGAGGLHAAAVSEELSFPRAIVPREASVLCALGFLTADVRHDYQRALGERLEGLHSGDLDTIFSELEDQARADLAEEGFVDADMRFARFTDCRYLRQIYNVPVALESSTSGVQIEPIINDFERIYSHKYKHLHGRGAIVLDTCRLVAYGSLPDLSLPRNEAAKADAEKAQRGSRKVFCGDWLDFPVFWFDELDTGMRIEGPALIDSASTSVVIPPNNSVEVDSFGSLIITRSNS